MAVEPLLAGLVVIRRDEQGGIGSSLLSSLGQRNGLTGRVGTRACDDEAALVCGLNGDLDDLEVLLVVESGRLPGGSNGNDARDASCNLLFDELAEGLRVELAVTEWRNERGVCSCECHG